MSSKGKGKAKEVVSRKRKSIGGGAGESRRKRKNPGVLQFFEDAADVDDNETSDEDDWENSFMDEEPDLNVNNETGKAHMFPFVPKEEVIEEEEFDKMMEERYKDGTGFVTYAEDSYEAKGSIDRNSVVVPSSKDPTIWKVKCVVGRERHSAFCLMQKFVDMKSLGSRLQIISAFSVDHIKGFFYIEADKQCDISEACKGLTYVYPSRVAPVPSKEVHHLLSVRAKRREVSKGTWARVKNGNYKGDLCQVVAVNNERKRATVKLIPRIDLQAMAAKFGGGVSLKKTVIPVPKLISSSELEEFLPLIQFRRDRETGIVFQILDGLMLKDGYLYKRVSIESISCWGVMPTEEELLKFSHSENNESGDMEWLSQLYGENRKKKTVKTDKGGEKGEGSSAIDMEDAFELYHLVCFGRKDFGLIVGIEKDGHYKILKETPEGPVVVTVARHDLKTGPLDTKFTASDQHSKTISINDTVKVLEGQHEGKQGIVKQIYRGTIFLYDENETDNGGFFCCKSQMCEKIKQFFDVCKDKGGEPGTSGFEDFMSSPKSPLSPKKSWQEKETRSDFNRGNRDGMFSIGQTLRIRVGPLKGYLCRVLAVHYSDVTVKLDSKQKVLTVKNEHLSEVQGKSFAANTSEHDGSSSFKPFDLGTEGSSGDWLDRSGASAEGGVWNTGRSSWPNFSAGTSNQAEANNSNPCGSWDTDLKKDGEDSAWGCKVTSNQSSWGAAGCSGDNNENTGGGANTAWETELATKQNSAWAAGGSEQVGSGDSWNKAVPKTDSGSGACDAWGKAISSTGDPSIASKDAGGSWGQAKLNPGNPADSSWEKDKNINAGGDGWKKSDSWDKGKSVVQTSSGAWDNAAAENNPVNLWDKGKSVVEEGSWEKRKNQSVSALGSWDNAAAENNPVNLWDKGKSVVEEGSWEKKENQSVSALGSNQQESCGKKDATGSEDNSWGKATEKWSHKDGFGGSKGSWGSSMLAPQNAEGGWGSAGGSLAKSDAGNGDESNAWKKANDVCGDQTMNWNSKNASEGATCCTKAGSWNQYGGSSWGKHNAGPSWSKQVGGSSEGEQPLGNAESNPKGWKNQNDGWNKSRSSGSDQGPGGWAKQKMQSEDGTAPRDSGWGKGSNWNSKSSGASLDSNWARKNDSHLGSGEGTQNSSWEKKTDLNSEPGDINQDWGKKSSWGSGPTDAGQGSGLTKKGSWNSGSVGANEGLGWAKKNDSGFGSDDATKDSGWGKKSDWNSGPADANQHSNWGKKSTWGAGTGDSGQDSGWGNSGSGSAGQDSGWSKKSNWNLGPGDASQDSGWGKKSNWNSGNGNEDQSETFNSRGSGGSWREGFGGRDGSDKGFRGRGNTDRGGFRGRGRGYGGRERSTEDLTGGFGGRSGDGESYGSRGGDRGGYRGRGGDRGGFGGRGRGRRDPNGDWSNGGQSSSWNKEGNNGEGWKSKSWNPSNADQGGQSSSWNKEGNNVEGWKSKSWNPSNADQGSQSSGWNQSKDVKGGWNIGTGSSNEAGGSLDNNLNLNKSSSWTKSSSWNQPTGTKDVKESKYQGHGSAGGWDSQGSGWNRGAGSGDQAGTWNQSNTADRGLSSGQDGSKDVEATRGNQDSWGKATSSSWGQGSGGSKGGW